MNISTSECSSGCESGWTMYLNQLSNNSTDPYNNRANFSYNKFEGKREYVNEEDEDLSMVSDASSGPPQFQDYEHRAAAGYYSISSTSQGKKKTMQKNKTKEKRQQNLCLDDTATSPIFHFSQDNVAPYNYQNVPAAQFEGENKSKKHLGFFKSSTKGKSGSLLGRKRQ